MSAGKVCTGCQEFKNLDSFSKHPNFKDGRNSKCKACKNQMAATYYQENKERLLAAQAWEDYGRAKWLREKYGLTIEEYDALLVSQDGRCAICRKLPTEKRFHVDHCHVTGRVRKLLCYSCNAGLGLFKDNLDILREAVKYLEYHAAQV